MKFLRRGQDEPTVNLTPLIDIVFLLLIFFMLSTRFIDARQLPLELPAAASAQSSTAAQTIEVRVTADGAYQVAGNTVAASGLPTALKRQRTRYPERSVHLRADGQAPHAAVVRVLDAAATVGFDRVDIATRPRE